MNNNKGISPPDIYPTIVVSIAAAKWMCYHYIHEFIVIRGWDLFQVNKQYIVIQYINQCGGVIFTRAQLPVKEPYFKSYETRESSSG